MRYKPSIADNIMNWQVFEDDQQLKHFLELVEEFSATHIDEDMASKSSECMEDREPIQEDDEGDIQSSFLNQIIGHKIIQLKILYFEGTCTFKIII